MSAEVPGFHQPKQREEQSASNQTGTRGETPGKSHSAKSRTRRSRDTSRGLNGHDPANLYQLVIGEVERPLLKNAMDYAGGNKSQAAKILGINRGTLRKKLKFYELLQE